mmetsp:Transcript_42020/g.48700  ORF Transcript_42020/g.48700 Transcript_42020/m.48700 type:complete len:347 (+) Transcript_42020:203-1243(+)
MELAPVLLWEHLVHAHPHVAVERSESRLDVVHETFDVLFAGVVITNKLHSEVVSLVVLVVHACNDDYIADVLWKVPVRRVLLVFFSFRQSVRVFLAFVLAFQVSISLHTRYNHVLVNRSGRVYFFILWSSIKLVFSTLSLLFASKVLDVLLVVPSVVFFRVQLTVVEGVAWESQISRRRRLRLSVLHEDLVYGHNNTVPFFLEDLLDLSGAADDVPLRVGLNDSFGLAISRLLVFFRLGRSGLLFRKTLEPSLVLSELRLVQLKVAEALDNRLFLLGGVSVGHASSGLLQLFQEVRSEPVRESRVFVRRRVCVEHVLREKVVLHDDLQQDVQAVHDVEVHLASVSP